MAEHFQGFPLVLQSIRVKSKIPDTVGYAGYVGSVEIGIVV